MLYEFYMDRYVDHLEKESEKQRTKALEKFTFFVSQPDSIDVIARIIASGFLEENPDAIKIVDKLNIDKLEIFSLLDEDLFKNQYEKETQLASDSEAYNNNYYFGG